MSNKGYKLDNGKAPMTLFPYEALEGATQALKYGIEKYGKYNFTEGIEISRLLDAASRHLYQYVWVNKQDPETGLSHLDHALASLAMAKWMEVNRKELTELYTDKKEKE